MNKKLASVEAINNIKDNNENENEKKKEPKLKGTYID